MRNGPVVLVAGAVLLSSLAVCAPSRGAAAVKGIRAILFHGAHLSAPVRMDRAAGAENLYRALLQSPAVPHREPAGRPCVYLAVYSEIGAAQTVPLEQLLPQQADFAVTYYPPVRDEPALAHVPGNRTVEPAPGVVKLLASLGITPGDSALPCGQEA